MKAGRFHILLAMVLVACLSACGQKGKIIPRSEMAEVYADLFMADQWILYAPEQSRVADTTMVYERVFNMHGYTTKDYVASVDYYLRDPKRYSRILKKTDAILSGKLDKLNALVAEETELREQLERLCGYDRGLKLYYDTLFLRVTKEAGLRFEMDSCGRYLPVVPAAPDTLAIEDSLACPDSLHDAGIPGIFESDRAVPELVEKPVSVR